MFSAPPHPGFPEKPRLREDILDKKPWSDHGYFMDVSVTEFKAKCVGIIGKVQRERCHVVIRRHGQPAAELVPVERGAGNPRLFGRAARTTELLGDLFSTGEGWNAEA